MNSTRPTITPEALDAFLALSDRKERGFDAILAGLAPQYQPSAISEDGSQLTLSAVSALEYATALPTAKIILLAYAPSESSIIVDPCLPLQEWTGCFGLEIPARTLLQIANLLEA